MVGQAPQLWSVALPVSPTYTEAMEGEILRLAAAAPTRGLVEDLAERLGSEDLPGLAAEALASGDLRAAINLALAGVLAGRPPSGELAVTLLPAIEDTQIAIRLLGSVESGLLDALLRASSSGRFTPGRQGLILFLAATLAGDPPPDELRRRIRLAARADLDPEARTLVGLAALEVGDPDVLEVAHECARGVDGPGGRRLRRDVLRRFRAPLREALPEDAPSSVSRASPSGAEEPRVGRNEPCPCGSGRKYKKCCIGKEDRTDETPDAAVPWGDRARLHRSMTDDQFRALHPLELARLAPEELSTTRLIDAIQGLAPYRLFSEVDRFLAELDGRSDLPGGRTPDEVRADVLVWTLTALDREATTRVLAGVERPESLALAADLGLAVLARRPDALERIEEQAAEGLREPGSQALGKLCATLLFFSPALGILASRGALDTCHDTDVERLLEAIEEARDHLLLPPGDPAWELYDLLSDRRILEQLQTSVAERSEQLAHEARELRRAAATARGRGGRGPARARAARGRARARPDDRRGEPRRGGGGPPRRRPVPGTVSPAPAPAQGRGVPGPHRRGERGAAGPPAASLERPHPPGRGGRARAGAGRRARAGRPGGRPRRGSGPPARPPPVVRPGAGRGGPERAGTRRARRDRAGGSPRGDGPGSLVHGEADQERRGCPLLPHRKVPAPLPARGRRRDRLSPPDPPAGSGSHPAPDGLSAGRCDTMPCVVLRGVYRWNPS
jgi:hypothetical protein